MKQTNNSLTTIAKLLNDAENILILTHVIIDGDSAGSAVALSHSLKKIGKKADIYAGEILPDNLCLLDSASIKLNNELEESYDTVVTLDCSDISRFEDRLELFNKAKVKINIDHHKTNDYYADYNYIDTAISSTGEIIFNLIKELGQTIDVTVGTALYIAMATDTGNFQYSNTSAQTLRIVAEIYDVGINVNEITISLYQNTRIEKLLILKEIIGTVELISDGKAVFAYATLDMQKRAGAQIQDTDGMVETLRDIKSVEISVFVKEVSPGKMKVGFRSKQFADVTILASKFDGGGHDRAAGCTINGTIEEVKKLLYPEITNLLDKYKL